MKKQILVTIKGGMVQSVYSNDNDVSVTIIDIDIKKDIEGLSNQEVSDFIKKETKNLTQIISTID